jgi:hypothetical protein
LLLIGFRSIVARSGRVLNLLSVGAVGRVVVAVSQYAFGFSPVGDSRAPATTPLP